MDDEIFAKSLVCKKDNIYIKLLFSELLDNNTDIEPEKVFKIYSNVMTDIYNYAKYNVSCDTTKDYERIIKRVCMDDFKFAIMDVDEKSDKYEFVLSNMGPYIV